MTKPPLRKRKKKVKRERNWNFSLTVLGRTLEHLGSQMYKRRDVALAELVANCWDAGATKVYLDVPDPDKYDPSSSVIRVRDDGLGMDTKMIQDAYLAVGRNRRRNGADSVKNRPVMGRKGIGKLAGFGIARVMTVTSWRDGKEVELPLNAEKLKTEDNDVTKIQLTGKVRAKGRDKKSKSGTEIALAELKHITPIDIDKLHQALARRFSRKVKGEMSIYINNVQLQEPSIDFDYRHPETGMETIELDNGKTVKVSYGFAKSSIPYKELRGFTIYMRGKTAQAPPFFFGAEVTGSGQHSTRYISGEIEADFLDQGTDDESDLTATDRQELDWDDHRVKIFFDWGHKFCGKLMRECANRRKDQFVAWLLKDNEINNRIDALDKNSKTQVKSFLGTISKVEKETDRARELADALVKAYEFRQFHDVIDELEAVGDDPEQLSQLLSKLNDWRVLESRAILEIVEGRLAIIDKFHALIVEDTRETAHKEGQDNMHDLLAQYPWLIDPEWQVLSEEKGITTQLREWLTDDLADPNDRSRYDFLALSAPSILKVIEIKRSGHPVDLDELQRLESYANKLGRANSEITMVLICGKTLNVSPNINKAWLTRDDLDILSWAQIHERAKLLYEHYRDVLSGNVSGESWSRKEREVAQTRRIMDDGTVYRGQEIRKTEGIGPSDVDYGEVSTGKK